MYVSRKAIGLLLIVTLVSTLRLSVAQEAGTPTPTANLPVESLSDNVLYLNSVTLANLSANQLGIEVAAAEGALKAQLGIEGGLVVTKAPEESEGAKAGLQAHDVILNINAPRSEPVRDVEKFNAILTENAGKKIEIGLLRGGKMQLVGVDIPARQELILHGDNFRSPTLSGFDYGPEQYRIGVTLSEADETLRTQLQLPAGEGLVVTEVLAGTAAEKAEIKQHDVLVELEERHLANVEQINKQIQEIKARPVKLKLLRCGKSVTVEVTPEKVATSPTSFMVPRLESQLLHTFTMLDPASGSLEVQFIPSFKSAWVYANSTAKVNVDNSPRTQLEALKHQLAEMQKAVIALDALLPAADSKQNPPTEEKPSPPAEEGKK